MESFHFPIYTIVPCLHSIASLVLQSQYQSLKGGSVLISEVYITQVCIEIEGEYNSFRWKCPDCRVSLSEFERRKCPD